MDVNKRDRRDVWTPLFFSVVLVVGIIIGFNLRDTLRNKRNIVTVIRQNDKLEELIDLVNEKYVDTVNTNQLYKDAISGILKSLDPHTVYIPADELQSVNDDLDGGFSGIGVEFSVVRDTLAVTGVIDNGPANHAGIEIGDQVIKVDNKLVAGVSITADSIVHLLKGKQHSNVSVTLKQSIGSGIKQIPITRDIIPTYSVEASIMLNAATGFIKINRFTATTYDEFSAALKKLQSQGAQQLIIDLRDNPGGYLDAATSIADDLLDDNKLIVYTKGTHTAKTEYRASGKGLFEKGKLAILIDEGSASASEILSGAVQDWDRGVIIGRRSFGKGLVQEQYDLPNGAALRLTVAKYYTPSGRCIQRSFANGKEAYMEDFEKRFETGELVRGDSVQADTTPFYTSTHRVVYGGGGIKPDVFIPYDTSRLSAALQSMIYSQELKTAVWDYFIENRKQLKFKDIAEFSTSFNAQSQIADKYLVNLGTDVRKAALKELSKPANNDYFKLQIKAQLARLLFRDNGYYTISLKDDDAVNKALGLFSSDHYLSLIGRK